VHYLIIGSYFQTKPIDVLLFPLQQLFMLDFVVPMHSAASLQLLNEFNLFPSISNCIVLYFLLDITPLFIAS
jgi:hypothetical protein